MGQTLMGRPTSQQFDPTFTSAGFNSLRTASSASAPNPQQFAGFTTPQPTPPPTPVATLPRQIVPRTIGMGGLGTPGFRGVTSPIMRTMA